MDESAASALMATVDFPIRFRGAESRRYYGRCWRAFELKATGDFEELYGDEPEGQQGYDGPESEGKREGTWKILSILDGRVRLWFSSKPFGSCCKLQEREAGSSPGSNSAEPFEAEVLIEPGGAWAALDGLYPIPGYDSYRSVPDAPTTLAAQPRRA